MFGFPWKPKPVEPTQPAEPEPAREVDPLRPRIRRGTPTRLADGRVWLLASHVPDLDDDVWDTLYDQNVGIGLYDPVDLRRGALRLLLAAYDIAPDRAIGLIRDADILELRQAVELAMFAPLKAGGLTFTDWMKAGLVVAGQPDWRALPGDMRKKLLEEMVGTRRIRPSGLATAVGQIRAKRARMKGSGHRSAPGPGSSEAG